MTPRSPLALLVVAALAAVSGALIVGESLRAMPLAFVAAAFAAGCVIGRRHPRLQRLQLRIGDVGDSWRALLLGAPPTLL